MISIYHNPRCRKSREGLAFLEKSGKRFEVIRYLEDIPTYDELRKIIAILGISVESLVRKNEIVWKEKFKGKLPLFGGLDAARFRRQVVPGDVLEMSVSLGRMSARAGKGTGVAKVNGEIACECELLFVIVDA